MPLENVIFSRQALHMFQSEIETYGVVETGGVMLGYIVDKTIYVEKVSNGGTKAIHDYLYFRADNDFIEMFIDMEIANSGGEYRYLGEWHTHPEIYPNPSELDLDSLEEIADSTRDFCVGLILGSLDYSTDVFSEQSICLIKCVDSPHFQLLETFI